MLDLQQGGESKRQKVQQLQLVGECETATAYSIKGMVPDTPNNQQVGISLLFPRVLK